jgi:hypothetical protein
MVSDSSKWLLHGIQLEGLKQGPTDLIKSNSLLASNSSSIMGRHSS